jgi:RNA polymerase sigma-70 factor, ECF subfamily
MMGKRDLMVAASEGGRMQRDLVITAGTGDHDAFAALARSASDRLYQTARLILRDDDAAADAVQDALVSAWLHIRAVRDPDRFDAWLNRLLVHSCYREARRSKRRRTMEVHVGEIDVAAVGDEPRTAGIRDEIERGFRRLKPDQRAVLVLHHYLGLPDAEAAVVLDIPVGTFKSRLNRASGALRASVEADQRLPDIATEPIR